MAKGTRIGILGGTFNPVHLGHLILAQDAMERFELNKVLFVPCATPPHKETYALLEADHRIRMLEAAIEGDLRYEISTIEIERGGLSYTIDTLRALRIRYPESELHLILGADSLAELHLWKDARDLLSLCQIVTLVRPGTEPLQLQDAVRAWPAPWSQQLERNIVQGHCVDISSTDVRRRVAEGLSIRYLVPAGVEMYIAEHGLYRR